MLKEVLVSCLIVWVTYELTSSTYRTAGYTRRGVLLTYSRIASLLGCGFVLFAIIIGLSIVVSPGITTIGIRNVLIAFVLMMAPGLWLVTGAARGQVLMTNQEVIYIKRHGSRTRIRWGEVAIVGRSMLSLGYDIRATDGRRIVVSDLLIGQKQFAEMVLKKNIYCANWLRVDVAKAKGVIIM